MGLIFSSHISDNYLEDLEELMFFNSQQQKVVSGIQASIEKYGKPNLTVSHGLIHINIGDLHETQSIFVFDSSQKGISLAGVVIFYRDSKENITILHIAISDNYTVTGEFKNQYAALNLFEELKTACKKIKGVKTITIFYEKEKIGKVKL
ncbi:MAG: hypothetical protein NT007_10585 [Candidatus Kapabacteria bacterium]|nr:hypothetical protein [Candidatus Kapabacteria bacterium]